MDIWRQRQQGASVNQVAAEVGITGSSIRQMTQRGARYVQRHDGQGPPSQEKLPPPQNVSIHEAAAVLGMSPQTVRTRIKQGAIASVKMGVPIHRIPLAEIDRYSREVQGGRNGDMSTAADDQLQASVRARALPHLQAPVIVEE